MSVITYLYIEKCISDTNKKNIKSINFYTNPISYVQQIREYSYYDPFVMDL